MVILWSLIKKKQLHKHTYNPVSQVNTMQCKYNWRLNEEDLTFVFILIISNVQMPDCGFHKKITINNQCLYVCWSNVVYLWPLLVSHWLLFFLKKKKEPVCFALFRLMELCRLIFYQRHTLTFYFCKYANMNFSLNLQGAYWSILFGILLCFSI